MTCKDTDILISEQQRICQGDLSVPVLSTYRYSAENAQAEVQPTYCSNTLRHRRISPVCMKKIKQETNSNPCLSALHQYYIPSKERWRLAKATLLKKKKEKQQRQYFVFVFSDRPL